MEEQLLKQLIHNLSKHFTVEQLRMIENEILLLNRAKETAIVPVDLEENNEYYVQSFLITKKIEGCTKRTIELYGYAVRRFLNFIKKPCKDVTATDIKTYLAYIARVYYEESGKEMSPDTLNSDRRCISSFYTWMEEEELITRSPSRKVKKIKAAKRTKKTVKPEDWEKIKDEVKNLRDAAILELLISSGLRVGEVANLYIKNIDIDRRSGTVIGKGNKERAFYFSIEAAHKIRRYINEERKGDNEKLFLSLNRPYKPLNISGIEILVRELGRKAGIERIHPHKLRRTFATTALKRGIAIEQIQQMMGHEKVETTLVYAQVDQEDVKHMHHRMM